MDEYTRAKKRIEMRLRILTGEDNVFLSADSDHADFESTVAFKVAKKWDITPEQAASVIADMWNGT